VKWFVGKIVNEKRALQSKTSPYTDANDAMFNENSCATVA
jgi:hypothetical protein